MERFNGWLIDRRRWSLLSGLILAASLGWIWASAVPADATTAGRIPSPREGFLAPDFSLETLDGSMVTLADLRGQGVVVNLWASWCPPCRAEMPALQRAWEDYQDRGLVILAVNTTFQDSLPAAAAFVAEHNLTFPIPLDRSGSVSNRYLLRALPSTYFVDREGVIRQVVVGGPMSEATIRAGIEEILQDTR